MKHPGWSVIFISGTDYEAELVKHRLIDAGIPAVLLSQRDHSWNLMHSHLSVVHVLVPDNYVQEALTLLEPTSILSGESDAHTAGKIGNS